MFVCRACVKSWRGPAPAVLLAGRRAAAARAPASASAVEYLTTARARTMTTTTTGARTELPDERPRKSHNDESGDTRNSGRSFTAAKPAAFKEGSKDAMSTEELEGQLTLGEDEGAKGGRVQEAGEKSKKKMETAVRRRYKYLNDEYTIAQTVEQMLKTSRFDEALYLTRLASKDRDVVVSWNHVIKYMFQQGRTNAAIKLYQEMKKRGQVPSARTYTVIFNGCSKAQNLEQAVHISTRIYYGMLADARLRPNVIHMNAVLETCARAKDIQAVFNIAKTANTTFRMPDCTTYTIILNAMRASTELPYEKPSNKKYPKHQKLSADVDIGNPLLEKPQVTIRRARATWEEILLNWRRGHLMVDERLVCSMGRILHLGTAADNADVLGLVEQTMGIPRLDREAKKLKAAVSAAEEPTEEPTKQADSPVPQGEISSASPVKADSASSVEEEVKEAEPKEVEAELAAQVEEQQGEPSADVLDAGSESPDSSSPSTQVVSGTEESPESVKGEPGTAVLETASAETDSATPETTAPPTQAVADTKGTPKEVTQFSKIEPLGVDYFVKPFTPKSKDPTPLYARPGPNTLSLVLAALANSRKTTLALPYWKLLTGPRYSIVPDLENCHQLLRTIKRGRSSNDAIEALLLMPRFAYVGKTFQLAMQVCTYNTLNPHAFQAAGKILDLMTQTALAPDASTLRLYLKVALTSNRHFLEGKEEEGEEEKEKTAAADSDSKTAASPSPAATRKEKFGKQITRALQRLWDPVRIVGNNVQAMDEAEATGIKRYALHAQHHQTDADNKKTRLEYIDLLKLMVSAADMIVSEKMADEATIRDIRISRNLLNRQVTRFYAGQKTTAPIHPEKRRVLGASYRKPQQDVEELERSLERRWTKTRG